ncbi:hypothetical protein RhiirB3_426754 [Rhizophagus irregularis]|nr:hypothetical protein RhiirB3_426754 [Rhizophagus irregularis]
MHGKTHTGFGPTAQFVRNVGIVIELLQMQQMAYTIQYTCGDSFEALANPSIEMENVGDET